MLFFSDTKSLNLFLKMPNTEKCSLHDNLSYEIMEKGNKVVEFFMFWLILFNKLVLPKCEFLHTFL